MSADCDGGVAVSLDGLFAAWPIRIELWGDDHPGEHPTVRHLSLDEGRALRDALAKAVVVGTASGFVRDRHAGAEPGRERRG